MIAICRGGVKTMATTKITRDTSVAEIVKLCPSAIFDEYGLKGYGGEHVPTEPLSFFAAVHQADLDELVRQINAEIGDPSHASYVYKENLQNFIYRRFFKASVAVVSSAFNSCSRSRHDLRLGRHVRDGIRLPIIS